ncbi:MAG: hypothetical protein ABFD54_06770 [Armatimonadota bacterium]|nr:hypothetical protein [bacterium]
MNWWLIACKPKAGKMSRIARIKFLLWSRPVFRTCEIICNHAARIFERDRGLTKALAEVEELNRERIEHQKTLNRIGSSHDHVCAECKGKCCGGARERDAFTDRVLQYPETPHRAGRRKEGAMAAYKVMADNSSTPAVTTDAEPVPGFCPELTTKGCRIPYELRPIQCTAYFCNATIDQLSPEECNTGSEALKGLMNVQIRTVMLALKSRSRKQ